MQQKAGSLPTGLSLVLTDDAAIELRAEGSGPAIILLPSLGRSVGDFHQVARELVRHGYRVLRPEPRGIGRSRGPMSGNTLHHLAADIASIIWQDGGAPCVVAGHAFGAKVARTLASDRPELVRALVILAGVGRTAIDPAIHASVVASSDPSLPDHERKTHLTRAFFAKGNDPTEWLEGWHPDTRAMQLEAETATAPEDFIGAGNVPILDVQAAEDAVVPDARRSELENDFGERVTIVVIERAGHALLPEQPQRVAAVMHDYVQSL